jgi:hypothetical protein
MTRFPRLTLRLVATYVIPGLLALFIWNRYTK